MCKNLLQIITYTTFIILFVFFYRSILKYNLLHDKKFLLSDNFTDSLAVDWRNVICSLKYCEVDHSLLWFRDCWGQDLVCCLHKFADQSSLREACLWLLFSASYLFLNVWFLIIIVLVFFSENLKVLVPIPHNFRG